MKVRLIVLAVLALAFIPLLGGCINDNTIVGEWLLEFTWAGTITQYCNIEFLANHTFVVTGDAGVWSLSGKNIEFISNNYPPITFVGTVNSNGVHMSGTMTNSVSQYGTWEATKSSGP